MEIQEMINGYEDSMFDMLETLVMIDSGSYCKAGVDRVGQIIAAALQQSGFLIEVLPQINYGNHLIGRRTGDLPGNLLLIGHLDTVFPAGSAVANPYRIIEGKAYGPGVLDMKACLVSMIFAIKGLLETGVTHLPDITVMLIGDEEIGSQTGKELIMAEGQKADWALVIEGARANGAIVIERKGTGFLDIWVKGRAAHAGNEPEVGRSAIEALARIILELKALNDFVAGTTVTVGEFCGGTARNVVAEDASAKVDLRFRTKEAADRLFEKIRLILDQSEFDGIDIRYDLIFNRPPLVQVPGSECLMQIVKDVMMELGIEFKTAIAGGASDGNFVSDLGVPTIDGLGPVGGMMCSPEEYLEVASLTQRCSMLALIIKRIGTLGGRMHD